MTKNEQRQLNIAAQYAAMGMPDVAARTAIDKATGGAA